MVESEGNLRELLANEAVRENLTDLLNTASVLSGCVIDKSYRVPDRLVSPITFTSLGREIITGSMDKYRRLKPNDVKLAVFFKFGNSDGLFVDLNSDVDAFRKAISDDVKARRIIYPHILGRELHDVAAELYPEKTSLNNSQTLRVLERLPMGVYQGGRSVVGPFGCLRSKVQRQLFPKYSVPGYLCSDETCKTIHGLRLETASSPIARARELVGKFIASIGSKKADEYISAVNDAMEQELLPSIVEVSRDLFDAVTDGLDLAELRTVTDRALRGSLKDPDSRNQLSKQIGAVISSPTDFVGGLEKAQLFQLLLLHSDAEIIDAVDACIFDQEIVLQEFEVRTSFVRRWDSNSDEPSASIGALGVRFTAPRAEALIANKLYRLLYHLYFTSADLDRMDLAYALEISPQLSDTELLGEAVNKFPPDELFRRLVLPNRKAAAMASEVLRICSSDTMSRDDLLKRLMWKVGVPEVVSFPDLRRVETYEDELQGACIQPESEETIRSHIANLFAAIEDALQRGLIYTTWALTEDHYLSAEGFVYDPAVESSILEFLNEHAPVDDSGHGLKATGKNTLVPLASGYARLAKALRKLSQTQFIRPKEQLPAICQATPRPFAFPYTLPFFNLSEVSQGEVLRALQATSRLMQDPDIVKVRNATIHGNNEFPSIEDIRKSAKKINAWRVHVEAAGFYPKLYTLTTSYRDLLGRETINFNHHQDSVTLYRPGWAVARRMPLAVPQLLIMPIAVTSSSGPLRFRLKNRPGKDPYWEGYPHRWKVRSEYGVTQHESFQQQPTVDGAAQALA